MPLRGRLLESLLTVRGLTVAALLVPVAILIQLSLDAGVPQHLIEKATPDAPQAPEVQRPPVRLEQTEEAKPAEFSWRELADTFQGWTTKVDGTMEWTVLHLSEIDPAAGRFRFTLNVGQYRQDGHGTFAATESRISMGQFVGLISRTGDGRLKLQSWPPDQRLTWTLTGRRPTKSLVEPENR